MEREYKFRAKNIKDGKLYYSEEIGPANFWMQVTRGVMCDVQQYIGAHLKDKDIYEGDIYFRRKIVKGNAIYYESHYVIAFGEYTDPEGNTYYGFNYDVDWPDSTGEIIGNIIENPELAPIMGGIE